MKGKKNNFDPKELKKIQQRISGKKELKPGKILSWIGNSIIFPFRKIKKGSVVIIGYIIKPEVLVAIAIIVSTIINVKSNEKMHQEILEQQKSIRQIERVLNKENPRLGIRWNRDILPIAILGFELAWKLYINLANSVGEQSLKNQLKEVTKIKESLEKSGEIYQSRTLKLKEENIQKESKLSEYEKRNQELESNVKRLTQSVYELNGLVQASEEELQSTIERAEKFQEETLLKAEKELNFKKDEYSKINKELNGGCEILKRKLAQKKSELKTHQYELGQLARKLIETRQHLSEKSGEVKILRERLRKSRTIESHQTQLKKDNVELEQKLEKATVRIQTIKNNWEKINKELLETQERLTQSEKQNQQLKKDIFSIESAQRQFDNEAIFARVFSKKEEQKKQQDSSKIDLSPKGRTQRRGFFGWETKSKLGKSEMITNVYTAPFEGNPIPTIVVAEKDSSKK